MNLIEKKEYINCKLHFSKQNAIRIEKMNLPKKLFRYRSLSEEFTFENLKKNKLWISSPDKFNDPYDTFINLDIDLFLEEFWKNDPELKEEISELSGKERRILRRYIEREKENCEKEIKKEIENLRKTIGIACFSESYDNILMWSHYADYHKGICLEYDFAEINMMTNSILLPIIYENKFEHLINYIDIKKDKIDTEEAMKLFLIKYTGWQYENEWRIIDSDESNCLINTPVPTVIYLGCKIDHNQRMKLEKIARSMNIPVKCMRMSTKYYKLVL